MGKEFVSLARVIRYNTVYTQGSFTREAFPPYNPLLVPFTKGRHPALRREACNDRVWIVASFVRASKYALRYLQSFSDKIVYCCFILTKGELE
jgi:hypothetical protein